MDGFTGSDRRREAASAAIRTLRERLLDLTARNPLISFPHSRQIGSRTNVRAIDEHINVLWARIADGGNLQLVALPPLKDQPEDERASSFQLALEGARGSDEDYKIAYGNLTEEELSSPKAAMIERALRDRTRESLGMPRWKTAPPKGLAEYATSLGLDPSFDLAPSPPGPSDPDAMAEAAFQTLMLPDPLDRNLAKIRETARTLAEETGVSTLHLAIGFLEWFESESSERAITSPLLLIRVDIDRKIERSRFKYSISGVGDDAQANMTLSARLDRDFKIKLPEFDGETSPEDYLSRIQAEVCKPRDRWVVRKFVTLAHFPFARLAMYQDLDESLWTEAGGLAGHPILGQLLGGAEPGQLRFAEEHDVDAAEVAKAVPLLVLSADASQHSAVFDAMSGKNLIIQGPPGTGKSQTITNIIAAGMANGKRVLFLADKQAALQVVKDRLDGVELGDFCLELHSGKSQKKEVIAALKRRLERAPTSGSTIEIDAKVRDAHAARDALKTYVSVLNSKCGACGLTVHDILWADRRGRSTEDSEARLLDNVILRNCEEYSASDIEVRMNALKTFEDAAAPILQSFGVSTQHPWFGLPRDVLSAINFEAIGRAVDDLKKRFDDVTNCAAGLASIGVAIGSSIQKLQLATDAISEISVPADMSDVLYQSLSDPTIKIAAGRWSSACVFYRNAISDLKREHAILDPTAGDEIAQALEVAWGGIATNVPLGATIADVSDWMRELSESSAKLLELARSAAQSAAIFGLPPLNAIDDITLVVRGIELAARTEQFGSFALTSRLLAHESGEVVGQFTLAVAALKKRELTLFQGRSAPEFVSPETARKHAAALRETGIFASLKASTKSAAAYYKTLVPGAAKVDKIEMADWLTAVSDYQDAVSSLDDNEQYRSLLGRQLKGTSSDAVTLNSIIEWSARIRSEFSDANEVGRKVRQTLLSGDQDRLRAASALHKRDHFQALRDYIAAMPDRATSLVTIASDLSARAKSAKLFLEVCQRYEIPAEINTSRLPTIFRLLRASSDAEAAARLPDALAKAWGIHAPAALSDHTQLDGALALASAIDGAAIEPSVKHRLYSASAPQIRELTIPAAQATASAIVRALEDWLSFCGRFALSETRFFGRGLLEMSSSDAAERLARAGNNKAALGGWLVYLLERERAETLDLEELLAAWDRGELLHTLPAAFERVFRHSLARVAFQRYPELDRFTGLGQDEARRRFQSLDNAIVGLRRKALAADLSRRPIPEGNQLGRRSEWTEEALVRLEVSKQKKHLPIRQLLDRAGRAVQAMKPCFMMSPLAVSQYLKPTGLQFDLLVIDEASQMRPEDALGAIARCEQIIVVGDPKQLPPTAFFSRKEDSSDDDNFDEENVDAESILDVAQTVFRPMRRLRWHYRSRHGSLIAFSNREFYDDDLIVFPSPAEADPNQGVTLVKVEGLYRNRANMTEVEAICQAAADHMRQYPDLTLGIATMNQVQRDHISQAMDALTSTCPEVEAYRDRWSETLERFFVKNIETVQGDERDVIFISTLFGPSTPGVRPKQSFGPINGASGHRRLNVLFTRAKRHVRVFTSMTPDDILAGPDGPLGAQVLRRYLAYAADGRLDAGVETNRDADSDFEIFVRDHLRNAGFEAVPQVGVAGFFIDLAVRHPDVPGTFLLGIECDGASYHSSKSARDRDILRQEILEGLGWSIYRIWSTDWFRDPSGQTKKLVAHIQELRAASLQKTASRRVPDFAAVVEAVVDPSPA